MALPKLIGLATFRQEFCVIQRSLSNLGPFQQTGLALVRSHEVVAGRASACHILPRKSPVSATWFGGQRRAFCAEEGGSTTSFNVQDYDDFRDRVINSDRPVIVDFHAGWCGPCKLLGPRLESQVDSRDDRVLLAKVDVDDNAEIAMEYGVQSVPHVLAMKGGEVVDQFVGLQEDAVIETFIDRVDTEHDD